jgi:hypothetical protein
MILDAHEEPSEWTADHDRLLATVRAAGIHRSDPQPSHMVVTAALEDVDGDPLAVYTARLPMIGSA